MSKPGQKGRRLQLFSLFPKMAVFDYPQLELLFEEMIYSFPHARNPPP